MHTRSLLLAAFAAALAFPAAAESAYDLRAFTTSVGFPCCDSDLGASKSVDLFNNGNPLIGPAYTGTAGASSPVSYSALNKGFSVGAETSGADPDPLGDAYQAGHLRFSKADALATPINLQAPGTVLLSKRVRLNDPGPGTLLNRGQSFEVATYWNFAIPASGEAYGIRLTDNPVLQATADLPFNDQITLDVIRSPAGEAVLRLQRITFDGSLAATSQTFLFLVANQLIAGHTLAEVTLIELNLHYNTGIGAQPFVLPMVNLEDADGNQIGHLQLPQQLTIFNGEDFSHVLAVTHFSAPVPEPGSAALLLFGLALTEAWRIQVQSSGGRPTPRFIAFSRSPLSWLNSQAKMPARPCCRT